MERERHQPAAKSQKNIKGSTYNAYLLLLLFSKLSDSSSVLLVIEQIWHAIYETYIYIIYIHR